MHTDDHTPKKLSVWKHLVIIWGGGIIAWPLLTALVTSQLLPSGEAFTLTLIVFMLNIFTGWAFALMVFVWHWGIRGWIETARQFSRTRDQQQAAAAAASAQYLDAPTDEEQMQAQWAEMNHVGCCMSHRDEHGYPSHGGPDCRHPEVVGQQGR